MARLKREQVTVGAAAAILAKSDISRDGSNSPGGSFDGDMVPTVGVPMGYYVKPIDDQWAVGFGIYAPFGLATDYENGFAGRYFGSYSKISVVTCSRPSATPSMTRFRSVSVRPSTVLTAH
jgi:long-chain fatty acid transport protein